MFIFILYVAFDYLDAPVHRISGADIPTPYAGNLEKLAFPESQLIVDAVHKLFFN